MCRRLSCLAIWTACVLAITPAAHAASVTFEAVPIAGSTWRYDYTLRNDSAQSPIDELAIVFDLGRYADLEVVGSPAGWDSLVLQPDPAIPDDGIFDALALSGGLQPSVLQSGFAVQFTWLASGAPGSQVFRVLDPNTFETLETGLTTPAAAVPLPAAFWLLLSGMGLLGSRLRIARSAAA